MARLGELLVAAGVLTSEQLDQALRAQVMWGGRLGTNLVELGAVDLDAIAKALGQQHRMPAALAKHFEKVDPELQKLLSPDVAEKFLAVPLQRVGPERNVIIATCGPLAARARAIIADELVVDPEALIPSVAAELRVRYHLERVYNIPRDTRFLRSRGKTIPPFPMFDVSASVTDSEPEVSAARIALELQREEDAEIEVAIEVTAPPLFAPADQIDEIDPEPEPEPEVAQLDDLSADAFDAEPSVETEAEARERRRYVPTLAEPEVSKLGRVAIVRKVAATTTPPTGTPIDAPMPVPGTLGEATRQIRRAPSRDRVAEIVLTTIAQFIPDCDAALFLILRGEVAIGWKGFLRSGGPMPQLAVPLDQESLVTRTIRGATSRCKCDDRNAIDARLADALAPGDDDLACVPVAIGGRVMCVITAALPDGGSVTILESIAAATGAAFARLMRDASR